MRRTLLPALAVALLAALSAGAHPGYDYAGGCRLTASSDAQTWSGSMSVAATATDAATGAPAPVAISAECQVYVNGVYLATFVPASGIGFAAAADTVAFAAGPDDVVSLCAYVNVEGEPHFECSDVVPATDPPGPVNDLLPPPPLPVTPFGVGCSGGWTDSEQCLFSAPAGAFAATGYAQPYRLRPEATAHLTVRVYVLVGLTPVTVGSCSHSSPGVASCGVRITATPYPGLPHFCEVTGVGNFGYFGCGDPPPLPGA